MQNAIRLLLCLQLVHSSAVQIIAEIGRHGNKTLCYSHLTLGSPLCFCIDPKILVLTLKALNSFEPKLIADLLRMSEQGKKDVRRGGRSRAAL